MLYFAGDSGLDYFMERAIEHLEELPAAERVSVLVLFDGKDSNYSWRYEIQPNGNYTVGVNMWFLGEVNTGDGNTLAEFVTWAHDNYPAQRYYLSVANHGRGSTGIAWDDTSGEDFISPLEMHQALDTVTNGGQWRIDVLHYDACLMGMLEQAYEAKDYADYWIASQNLGIAVFAYERYAQAAEEGLEPRDLAVRVAQEYAGHESILARPRTIAAHDLRRVDEVVAAVDELAAALEADIDSTYDDIHEARRVAQKFDSQDYYDITEWDVYLDLYDLSTHLVAELSDPAVTAAAQAVQNAVEEMVVFEYHASAWPYEGTDSLDNARGLSIYFPPDRGAYEYGDYVYDELFSFTLGSRWDEFLRLYFQVSGLTPPVRPDPGIPPMLLPGIDVP